MKKIFSILFIVTLLKVNAQKLDTHISGIIIDKESNTPLEYATISISNSNETNIKYAGLSDKNGNFKIDVSFGTYDVKVEYVSFKELFLKNIIVNQSQNLGSIFMIIDENILDEVEVVGEKTEVEIKLDKTVYNIGKDLILKGSSVSDVLDNLPSLAVDIDGNISLRGNQNVRILINGKPSGLVGISSNDALKQFPSESVEKVEIITSPSARYNAEGTAGIINIVLKKNKLRGLNGSLSIKGGDPKSYGSSGNLNFRKNKINFFSNLGTNFSTYKNISNSETEYYIDNRENNFLNETGSRNSENNSFFQNTGIEYLFSYQTSLVLSYLNREGESIDESINNIDQNFQNVNKISQRIENENENDNTYEFSINLSHEFLTMGTLTMDYQKENSNEIERGFLNNTQKSPSTIKYASENISSDENQNSELYKIDYVVPINEDGQFEIGYRKSNRFQNTNYLVEDEQANGNFLKNSNLSNSLFYNEKINAFYTQYGNKKGKFSYLLGLRIEESKTVVKQKETNSIDTKKYNDIFPTINIALELNKNQTITLGYNRRISRPRSYFINPFPSRSSETSFFQGNPYLDPTYSNGVDLGFLNKLDKTTLNGSIYYKKSQRIFTFINESTGNYVLVNEIQVPVIRRSPINLSNREEIGVEFNTSYSHSRYWRISGNINLYQSEIIGTNNNIVYDSKNFIWSGRVNNYLKIFSNIDWQTRFSYYGPESNAISTRKARIRTNTALSRDFFGENMTLTFKINDIFETQKWRLETFNETYRNYTEASWRGGRSFSLDLIYRFNQKKNQRNRGNYEEYDGGGFGK
ncbi:MAG: outer membrane beta-barrel protein [Flavobacteriaceae bacterium]